MNASKFLDKQIMDLSRSSKTTDLNKYTTTDFMDLMNPQSEEEQQVVVNGGSSSLKKNDEILPNYDFQPIHRPVAALQSDPPPPPPPPPSSRVFNSIDSKHNSSTLRSYNSVDHAEPDRLTPEKAQRADDSAILSEIDGTMKRCIDNVLHAMDGVSARLTQMESRTRYLEDSMDELKESIGNNHGSADGKMRQLENILLQVQSGVQDLKDKQDVMEGHMQLAKLQISKAEKASELSTTAHDSMQQNAASAPPQQPGIQQFSIPAPQQVPSVPPNASLSSQQNIYPPPATPQYPSGPTQPVPQRDPYFTQPSQAQEPHSQQYQMPPPAPHQQQPRNPAQEAQTQQYQIPPPSQHQQQTHTPAPPPQQYPSTPVPPYSQPPQPPQQQHPTVVGANSAPVPPSGYRAEEGPYMPPQTYPPNLHQPAPQPNSMPPQSQPYYGSLPNMYEPPSTGRSSSGFPSPYGPPSGPGEQYTYGGPASQYSSGSSIKAQPHSPVGSNSNYPQLPTARILPPSIPSAAGINGGSSSGASGNKVPIDDVVEKVTNMGFPKDVVRATVRKLTETGQSVDLNVVLDKLMNDGDAQSQRGWFGR